MRDRGRRSSTGRAVAYVSGGGLLLRSRLDRDITATYPELASVASGAGRHQLILDGEIVASGTGGKPDLAALQRRMHVRRPSAALAAAVPVTYLVFDVMHVDGQVLLRIPYAQRRPARRPEPGGPRCWRAAEFPRRWAGCPGRQLRARS
jgi:bifunctional non-homologous end joining protein LigD